MSLDVYLYVPRTLEDVEIEQLAAADLCEENGMNAAAEFLREGIPRKERVFGANITHNLGEMADAAGVYVACWRPEESDWTTAKQLISPLTAGLLALQSDPNKFRELNPSNGWGSYEGLVRFVSRYLDACKEYPEAEISVSR